MTNKSYDEMTDKEKAEYHVWYFHEMEALIDAIKLVRKEINGGLIREDQAKADLMLLRLQGEKKKQEDRNSAFVGRRRGAI